jgi:hypothetical protein
MEEEDILSFLGSTKDLLLVHSSMDTIKARGKVNVMVTPQFYTLKKEELPFKYAFQAKKIAPSLFDGLVENIFESKYHVWQEGNKWVYVAYNPEEIADFLASKGLPRSKVAALYFVDQAINSFVNPLPLGSDNALVKLNDTMVVVPRNALDENMPQLKFSKRFTPRKGAASLASKSSENTFIDQKQALIIAGILALIGTEYFIEGKQKTGALGNVDDELLALYSNYPSLQSSYTREGITQRLQKLDREERKKRDSLQKIAENIRKGKVFKKITLSGTTFKVEYESANKANSKKGGSK